MFNQYPGTISKEFYAMLAEQCQTVDEIVDMVNFILGDGQ